MKKFLLIIVAVIGFTFAANAQNNAIGVRVGGGQGYDAEISFQTAFGSHNRLEADLGYYGVQKVGALSLTGIYQFHSEIPAVANLGWYAGAGARVIMVTAANSSLSLGAVGQAGIDYFLDAIPLQFSLDIRPCFYLYPATQFYWGDIALGIRYKF